MSTVTSEIVVQTFNRIARERAAEVGRYDPSQPSGHGGDGRSTARALEGLQCEVTSEDEVTAWAPDPSRSLLPMGVLDACAEELNLDGELTQCTATEWRMQWRQLTA
jgi:hypothetical protein